MQLVVTGSIATDHLMTFPGRFTDSLVSDQLESISLSFLVDELDVRRGGVAANICFALGSLGASPALVGAVGQDFADYRSWLERHGVDTDHVHVSETRHTSRFLCTTDTDQNQIASFYAGAMSEAREIELGPVAERLGNVDLVVVAPNDPVAMVRHTQECRERGIRFAADPSQQLARMDGSDVRQLVTGAAYLFTNNYETQLLLKSTGWTQQEVLDQVGCWVMTQGADGVRIETSDGEPVSVPAVAVKDVADPTGVGDAFRAGFLWGVHRDLTVERAAQVGCALAAVVLESVGTQEYELESTEFAGRIARVYGDAAAAEIEPKLAR
ncbi:carbohydrate kinase family protein [Aeromicrobium sp. CTD01-1L150]|uniref:carbohydrate kinase family protein n=1 Tax=Aeromicrobium sp. CTD01-1L150 TaxID=3341830 RepID=UPI0035C14322